MKPVVGWLASRLGSRRIDGLKRTVPLPIAYPTEQMLALHSARTEVRIDRARADLGYEPAFDFEHGMQPTTAFIRWFLP